MPHYSSSSDNIWKLLRATLAFLIVTFLNSILRRLSLKVSSGQAPKSAKNQGLLALNLVRV